MADEFNIVLRLTSSQLERGELLRTLKDFSVLLGWEPSDQIEPAPPLERYVNAHLLVEHGLENAAVITFLASPFRQETLEPEIVRQILSISYNNLTDWHIYVQPDRVTYAFNRTDPPSLRVRPLSSTNVDAIRSAMFAEITGALPNANFPSLDDALVHNISSWKRLLAAELDNAPRLEEYSALFNSLIFARAAEDHRSRSTGLRGRLLLDTWDKLPPKDRTIDQVILSSLKELLDADPPPDLVDAERLRSFLALKPELGYDLLGSFYKGRSIPYSYDFSIMSKHALSRIYEKYVAALSFPEETAQLSYLPSLPEETYSKRYGSVYTPQFVARFFARYLREQLPPRAFRQLAALDPACGSGIFLRTLLEQQCAPSFDGLSSQQIDEVFSTIRGIDIDPNAVQATRLSLSLLYLVLMGGRLPKALSLTAADAIRLALESPVDLRGVQAIITNPPFVPLERQDLQTRQLIQTYMAELATGRIDTYMPFLKMAIESLEPEGYGLFVLPHSFLRLEAARPLREALRRGCSIRVLADLSDIPVFEEKGSYVVLLIFQKRAEGPSSDDDGAPATILLCQDFVSHALRDVIDGKLVEGSHYSLFQVEQASFVADRWEFSPPSTSGVRNKVARFQSLNRFLTVSQGVVTGADDVFILSAENPVTTEKEVWPPLLTDREMLRYRVPAASEWRVFYPILAGKPLSEEEVRGQFPQTWAHIQEHEVKLRRRRSADKNPWWRPSRPRDPSLLFSPKIVTPHLVILPKFSLDAEGRYAVTRSPFLTPIEMSSALEILKFYTAVLNSSPAAWLISTHTDKYSRGYARLEVGTLRSLPVPDPSKTAPHLLSELLTLVDTRLEGVSPATAIDPLIDSIIAELYGLDTDDLDKIGFEGSRAGNHS